MQVTLYGPDGQLDTNISSCGWSPVAVAIALGIGLLLILALFALGFRKYHAGMPVMGSCSQAISAACHPPRTKAGEENSALKPLMYGVMAPVVDGFEQVGFSSEEVRPLIDGGLYN